VTARAHPGPPPELCAPAEIREIERFLVFEARLLNRQRFEEWCDLFTDDGIYWIPALPDQADADETVSIIHADKLLLRLRIRRLASGQAPSQDPPPRTTRLVSNITVASADLERGEYEVGSDFVCVEYRDGEQRLFAGEFEHRLKRESGLLRIARKRVNLLNCDDAHELISVPF
jgi:benzoate/toluate 1,2-dioxygenase beta subunit